MPKANNILIAKKYIRQCVSKKILLEASKYDYCKLHRTFGMDVRNCVRAKFQKENGEDLLSALRIHYVQYEDLIATALKEIFAEIKEGKMSKETRKDPTGEDLNDPIFNAVWEAIKAWDIGRMPGEGRSGATGTDVMTIINAIKSVQQSPIEELMKFATIVKNALPAKMSDDAELDRQLKLHTFKVASEAIAYERKLEYLFNVVFPMTIQNVLKIAEMFGAPIGPAVAPKPECTQKAPKKAPRARKKRGR